MMKFYNDLLKYVPKCEQEEKDKELILSLVKLCGEKILDRKTTFAHMSASGFVLNRDFTKVLLVYHNIFKSWAWTGGHSDNDPDLFRVAKKEVMEETGVENLTPISSDIASIEVLPVYHHYKNGMYVSNHLHLNVTYVFIASEEEKLRIKEDENSGVMWVRVSELDKYVSEKPMIKVYEKIIRQAKEVIK